jgi:PadR family transcriptional regulator PadR
LKGTNLGELEELIILTVASKQNDAYSVAICEELTGFTGRKVKLGLVHSVLNRLEEKGFLKSKLGEATKVRGGKRKRYYEITASGKVAIIKSKDWRDQLWGRIPKVVLKGI